MSGVTNYGALQLLNASLANGNYEFPTSMYLGLYTVSPTASTPGTEVVQGVNYARIQTVFNFAVNGPPVQVLGPQSVVTFGVATGSTWVSLIAFGLSDGPSNSTSNLWYFGPLSVPRTINVGDQISFPINSLTVSLG
jgi:hypothetical protein